MMNYVGGYIDNNTNKLSLFFKELYDYKGNDRILLLLLMSVILPFKYEKIKYQYYGNIYNSKLLITFNKNTYIKIYSYDNLIIEIDLYNKENDSHNYTFTKRFKSSDILNNGFLDLLQELECLLLSYLPLNSYGTNFGMEKSIISIHSRFSSSLLSYLFRGLILSSKKVFFTENYPSIVNMGLCHIDIMGKGYKYVCIADNDVGIKLVNQVPSKNIPVWNITKKNSLETNFDIINDWIDM